MTEVDTYSTNVKSYFILRKYWAFNVMSTLPAVLFFFDSKLYGYGHTALVVILFL